MMSAGRELEEAYEGLRMKALRAGDKIQSGSQLLFVNQGMIAWLQSMEDLKCLGAQPQGGGAPLPFAQGLEPTALGLLTEMAINTWKEASSW
jgi:hypothetical protein